jgi:hypothetical protein
MSMAQARRGGAELTAHALRRYLEGNAGGEEHLRRRDVARAERGELVPEHVGGNGVPRRVLLTVERDHDLHARGAPRLEAVEMDAHVLASAEVNSFLEEQYSSVDGLLQEQRQSAQGGQ